MVLADEDSWNLYVAAQWWTVARWLDDHPDHPDAPAMRDYLDRSRRSHLAYGVAISAGACSCCGPRPEDPARRRTRCLPGPA